MLNLLTAFENFTPDIEVKEPAIDSDFITDFLLPYYRGLPRETLAAKVAEIIAVEKSRREITLRPR